MSLSDKLLKLVNQGNSYYYRGSKGNCKAFFIDGKQVGLVRSDIAKELQSYPDVFETHIACDGSEDKIKLSPELKSFEERSSKVADVLNELCQKNIFKTLAGWRNEDFDVWDNFCDPPLMKMERTATCLFGVKQCGVHINGYTRHPEKGLSMWVAQRAKNKPTWPGMLDQMAAGGLSSGEAIIDGAKRECQEEASVPEHILDNLKCAGCISYMYEDERGIFPECQYVMDLEVPPDFVPVNADGEVQGFELIPIQEMKQKITDEKFKFNCALVVLDFLIRHGYITPDNETNYFKLVRGIHDPLF